MANSRKLNGRCVAGLEWNGRECGTWLRPIAPTEKGELAPEGNYFSDPKLLDIIEVEFLMHKPSGCHVEDHLIDHTKRWVRKGAVTYAQLESALEKPEQHLWVNAGSTRHGINDLIPAEAAKTLHSSLKLIRPYTLVMQLHVEGVVFGTPRRRVRGRFSLSGTDYSLSITDSVIENEFKNKLEGYSRTVHQPILCLSITELFEKQNAHYKLIAGVIEARK